MKGTIRMRASFAIAVAVAAGIIACARRDASATRADSSGSDHAPDSAALNDARTTVGARYAAHWRGGQGFSLAMVRTTRAWFTPRLDSLLEADMSGDGIGVIDHDPFVDAQESARSYSVGAPRMSHDTAYVPVDITFDSTFEDPHSRVTLAMVRGSSGWRIGDFVDRYGSLATALAKDAAETARAASDAARQNAPIDADTGLVSSSGPLLVAVFATTQAEVDRSPDLGETLSDFESDLPQVADSLSRLGVHVAIRYTPVMHAEVAGHRLQWDAEQGNDGVGYFMAAPGKTPLIIRGMQDAEGVLQAATRYFTAK